MVGAEVVGGVAGLELDVVAVVGVADAGRRWTAGQFVGDVVAAGRLAVDSWDPRGVDTPG